MEGAAGVVKGESGDVGERGGVVVGEAGGWEGKGREERGRDVGVGGGGLL